MELSSAASQVVVLAAPDRSRRAIAALRPVDEEAPGGDLPAPRYPRYDVAQLLGVHEAYVRSSSVHAVRDELHIAQSAVRFQLTLAHELGYARLRRGAAGAGTTLADVRRDHEHRHHRCALEPTSR
jgi:hypothetical protein